MPSKRKEQRPSWNWRELENRNSYNPARSALLALLIIPPKTVRLIAVKALSPLADVRHWRRVAMSRFPEDAQECLELFLSWEVWRVVLFGLLLRLHRLEQNAYYLVNDNWQ